MTEEDLIFNRLEALERADPELAGPVSYYRRLIPILRGGQPLGAPPSLPPAQLQARLAGGQSLLDGFRPRIDADAAATLFRQVCQAVAEFQPAAGEALDALERGQLDLPGLLADLAGGNLDAVTRAAGQAQLAPLTARMLLEYNLRPTLRTWSESLLAGLDLSGWQRPACPACGSPPLLAEWHKGLRLRLLRCALCGASWPYPLRQCARCSSADPASQAILSADDRDPWLAQTCKQCRGYIKTLRAEGSIPHDLLSIEDLATLYIDQGCQQQGYTRFGHNPGAPPPT